MTRVNGVSWAALLALLAVGCAHGPSRETLLERNAGVHSYALPPEQVWKLANQLLREEGYREGEPQSTPYVVRTPWKRLSSADVGAVFQRYLLMGQQLEDGRFDVRYFLITYTTVGRTADHPGMGGGHRDARSQNTIAGQPHSPVKPVVKRDLAKEWALLRRLEPERAAQLEAKVDQYLVQHGAPAAPR
jgi:hypothetical protein